jgi:hypothetical protein
MTINRTWVLLAGALFLAPAVASAQCTGANHITWPTVNPVWDFCWTRPATSALANGEGIRISAVKYKGVTILKDGGVPVLNVQYVPGGCGGGGRCFRDWFNSERSFACAPSPSAGFCTGTTTAVATVCNHPGTDAGTFSGVAVEDLGSKLRLTSQAQAGWYRYISTWEFFPDGTLRPGMDITSVNNSCVGFTHTHHAYFRLDFDIDGSAGDFVDEVTEGAASKRVTAEKSYVDSGAARSFWRLGSAGSQTRVFVSRSDGDDAASGDSFAAADGWVLAYKSSELTDSSTSGCAINLPFANGENVDNADLVLWARSGHVHQGEAGGISHVCFTFGPVIKVRTREVPADFDGNSYSDAMVYRNGAWLNIPIPAAVRGAAVVGSRAAHHAD